MIYTHEDVLAQLKLAFSQNRDIRIKRITGARTMFYGYRVYNLNETSTIGAEQVDYYLTKDGYRRRVWEVTSTNGACKDAATGEHYDPNAHGAPGSEVSLQTVQTELNRLVAEREESQ